jgi:hypothetical protein
MEDTDRKMRAMQQAFWMSLSEEERLRRCGRLFSTAKRFAEQRAPDHLSAEDKKRFVFKELYGFERPF